MKASGQYFNESNPFDAMRDGCLLDAIEQAVSAVSEAELTCGWIISWTKADFGPRLVTVERPDGSQFTGSDIRNALRSALNAE